MIKKQTQIQCPDSLEEITEYLSREEYFEITPQDLTYLGYSKIDKTDYWVWVYLNEEKEQSFAIVNTMKVFWFIPTTCKACLSNPDNLTPDELLSYYHNMK